MNSAKSLNSDLPKEVIESLYNIFPAETAAQLRSSLHSQEKMLESVKKSIRSANADAEKQFKDIFNEQNVKNYVDGFFETHMNSIILSLIGMEESWHNGLQPKNNEFHKTTLYRVYQQVVEQQVIEMLKEKLTPALAEVKLSKQTVAKLTSKYRQTLEWKLERLIDEKAENDADIIFDHILLTNVEPDDARPEA
jgi:uncharacterized membrane protein YheB (UPF0754 family)